MSSHIERYLKRVIAADEPAPGALPALLRGVLGGLAGLYGAGLGLYLKSEDVGLRRRSRLPIPVISVGNLSVGGTGKTPMTAMICHRLADRGLRIAILSRGHGGSSQSVRVVSGGTGEVFLSAEDAGDEPVLLARACPDAPVIVGKDRRQSGREAMRRWPLDALVLDDGLQYWQLARDLDIALLDSMRPFDNGCALPRGLLREPAANIARAGIIVVTRAGRLDAGARAAVAAEIRRYAPVAPIYYADHRPESLVRVDAPGTNPSPLSTLNGALVIAVSGIAQPRSFHETLVQGASCRIVGTVVLDDHGRFDAATVDAVFDAVRRHGAQAVVMTEKDAVKWPAARADASCPLYALRIAMQVEREEAFLADVVSLSGSYRAGAIAKYNKAVI